MRTLAVTALSLVSPLCAQRVLFQQASPLADQLGQIMRSAGDGSTSTAAAMVTCS